MSYYQSTQMRTKVYVDGFRIDTIETPKPDSDIEAVALTSKVKAALQEEGKVVKKIVPVPVINPRFIIIETEY